jgi:hypothetical protein
MRLLQKMKHWQLFLLLFIPTYFINSRLSMIIIIMYFLTLLSAWIYSIGVLGQEKKIEIIQWTTLSKVFKISCLLMPLFWFINFIELFGLLNNDIGESIKRILNLIASFGFLLTGFFMIFYASMTLKEIELKRKPKFSDYMMTMIWFVVLPVGIWFIQPRINKI